MIGEKSPEPNRFRQQMPRQLRWSLFPMKRDEYYQN